MPGADHRLANLLGLSSVNRLTLYNQASHIGAQMLRIAKDIAENNRSARVLIVACELNTFGDGAAVLIVGADPVGSLERSIFEIMAAEPLTVPETQMAVRGHLK